MHTQVDGRLQPVLQPAPARPVQWCPIDPHPPPSELAAAHAAYPHFFDSALPPPLTVEVRQAVCIRTTFTYEYTAHTYTHTQQQQLLDRHVCAHMHALPLPQVCAGDVLYLPAMWWHYVEQTPCPRDGWCIAVNYWCATCVAMAACLPPF